MTEWEARNIVPDEDVPPGHKTGDEGGVGSSTDKPLKVGMYKWRDMFNPRQLLGHCTSVEVVHDMLDEIGHGGRGDISDIDKAALVYIAIAIDKLLNYNARMVQWHSKREVVAGVFDRHDFSFKWSYAEMAPTNTGLGYDWTTEQTGRHWGVRLFNHGGVYERTNSNQTEKKSDEGDGVDPVHVVGRGASGASIWKRQSPTGFAYYDFSLSRSWKSMSAAAGTLIQALQIICNAQGNRILNDCR
jgi:hypothetical protein